MDEESPADSKATESSLATPPERREKAEPPEPAPRPDPTRYGDWEKNGRCIDF